MPLSILLTESHAFDSRNVQSFWLFFCIQQLALSLFLFQVMDCLLLAPFCRCQLLFLGDSAVVWMTDAMEKRRGSCLKLSPNMFYQTPSSTGFLSADGRKRRPPDFPVSFCRCSDMFLARQLPKRRSRRPARIGPRACRGTLARSSIIGTIGATGPPAH